MKVMRLHHGSGDAVLQPCYERCRPRNDYGQGFYCTRSIELAKEWACQQGRDGFVSLFDLDMGGLSLVDLNSEEYCILHWLAVLLEHRLCRLSTPTMQQGAAWLGRRYSVDLSHADVVKGYRADDSYFGFARAFLRNEITLDQLSRAMRLGELGEQYMIKSPKAFGALRFAGSEPVDGSEYWPKRATRDEAARAAFREIVLQDAGRSVSAFADQGTGADIRPLYISTLMSMSEREIRACLQ